jgi:hypothetical protein
MLFGTVWYEGTIQNVDGTIITVKYDNGEEESHKIDDGKTYKLIAKPLAPDCATHHDGQWRCTRCDIWHAGPDGPAKKVCCSKCKVAVHQVGVLSSHITSQQRPRRRGKQT